MKKIIFFMMLSFTTIIFAQETTQLVNDASECVKLNFETPRCSPYNPKTTHPKSDDNYTQSNKKSIIKPKSNIDNNNYLNFASLSQASNNYQSTYTVAAGDTLGVIAIKFGVAQGEIKRLNPSIDFYDLKIGTQLSMPLPQDKIDAVVKNSYKEMLDEIAKKNEKYKIIEAPQGRRLRVMASAYTSHVAQSDSTPFEAAWGHHLTPGMKIIAVSRDLISEYGISNGTTVYIGGLDGYYTVRDKMNKRYTRYIDIYMGVDIPKALHWGRRSVIIYW
ncbi:MAG: LysM peptidoglycan-binding domain-containing protein [Sulfurovaceae bacterium]|nr:LysM peptidoglycan-binding domain-containing protein [Sulfurovaceae bacterium]